MSVITANGTIALFFAGLVSKIFGAIYRIPLSNFLGAEGMGLYQMAFPIYSFLLTIITGGISVSLTRKIASARARGDYNKISKDFTLAKRLCLILGFIFLIFLLVFAYPLSSLQGNSNAFMGYIAISVGFIFACMLGVYRGYYQGFSNMLPTAISQVLEQLIKMILGLTFASVFVKFGVISGVFGALIGVSVSEILCFVYFLIINRKIKINKVSINKGELKTFFKEFLPIGASYGVLPLSSLIDSFLIVNLLTFSGFTTIFSTSLYGIETGMILPLINMPNVLISAIALTAIPEISYKKEKGEDYNQSIHFMLKTVYMFILPCVIGLFILAKPILSVIYPNLNTQMLEIATKLLKFSVFEMFFLCFVSITNSILQALGKTKPPLYSLLIGMVIKIVLILTLVSNSSINIYGLVLASVFGHLATSVINIIKIKKESGVRFKLWEIIAPIISCIIMASLIYFFVFYLALSAKMSYLVAIIALSATLYFLSLAIFGELKIKEIKNLLQKMVK